MAAKCRSLFLFALLMVFISPLTAFSQNQEKEQRDFLFRLGFNDVSSIIREKLNNKEYATELNRRQMMANIKAYEVINASRELSISILNEVTKNPSKKRVDQLGLFVAKMLALKPLSPSIDYPSSILNIQDENKREERLVEWLHSERILQMNEHKKRLLSDLVTLLYDNDVASHVVEIKRLDQLLSQIVQCMYLDDTLGNGRYFGRALLALTLREEKLSGGNFIGLKEKIKIELKGRHNLYLENFVGDEMVLATPKGEKTVKIVNGTMMLSRNLSAGSLNISMSAVPKNFSDRWKARAQGLIGTPFAHFLYVEPEDMNNGITLGMRIRDRIAQSGLLRMGYSHIVYYQVLEDPQTGIKMSRVIDNYPNRVYDVTGKYIRTGGTRLTFAEQVIDTSHHSAVYFSNPVPEKVKEWSQLSVEKFGYQPEFSEAVELQLDDSGTVPVKNDRVSRLKTDITKAQFEKLHSEQDAKKLSDEIGQRFALGLVETVYEGTIFHWPDPYNFYLQAATYCSQLGDIVMRKKVGIPLEFHESQWNFFVTGFATAGDVGAFLEKNGLEVIGQKIQDSKAVKTAQLLSTVKIIAPITLALQPFMNGRGYVFVARTPEQKVQSSYLINNYREANVNTTNAIQQLVPLVNYNNVSTNIILDYGAAMRDIEYGIVMRASQGIKTPHISSEVVAALAVKKAMPAFLGEWNRSLCLDALKTN